jgi:hypothetical protein
MKVYNYSEARQNFAAILNTSLKEDVIISRKDGSKFRIIPLFTKEENKKSPFDIAGLKTKIKTNEIINTIRDMRERKKQFPMCYKTTLNSEEALMFPLCENPSSASQNAR